MSVISQVEYSHFKDNHKLKVLGAINTHCTGSIILSLLLYMACLQSTKVFIHISELTISTHL